MDSKIRIDFLGGEARRMPGTGVNYMIGSVDIDGEDVELYSEAILPSEEVPEDFGYSELKADIIEQAQALGISPDRLAFWYD